MLKHILLKVCKSAILHTICICVSIIPYLYIDTYTIVSMYLSVYRVRLPRSTATDSRWNDPIRQKTACIRCQPIIFRYNFRAYHSYVNSKIQTGIGTWLKFILNVFHTISVPPSLALIRLTARIIHLLYFRPIVTDAAHACGRCSWCVS